MAAAVSRSDRSIAIRDAVSQRLLSGDLIVNYLRGTIAEAIVAEALSPRWKWRSEDWAGWDFEHESGVKLEVKQSAARQTWSPDNAPPSAPAFDIKERTGFLTGAHWTENKGRQASIYIFAHHPRVDSAADHCDPEQWDFYVVPAADLPVRQTIGISRVRMLAQWCLVSGLAEVVEDLLERGVT
jgi:hypothetical protein